VSTSAVDAGPAAAPPRDPRDYLRRLGLVAVLLAAAGVFASVLNRHYPIQYWLFWRYAACWLITAVVSVACLSSGSAVLRALGVHLPTALRLYLSFATGLLLFFLALFVGGLLHLYGPVFAVALPLVLAASGFRSRRWRRRWPVWRRALRRPPVLLLPPGAVAMAMFGLAGLALVYIPTLTPENLAADAYWYHLTLAQHYAAAGGIIRSAEGSFVAAYPQLATIVYSWAFQLPRTTFFDRVEIAAHLEVMVFLWTLLGVGLLAAHLVPRRQVGWLWTSVFLFPGILLYDSTLSGAADHFLALWGPAILLSLLRAWDRMALRPSLVFAAMVAGAALTKYQAGCVIIAPIAGFAVRAAVLWLRPRLVARRQVVTSALASAGAILLLTAPHWAKNAIWYHDPFYPLLHQHLPSTPWAKGASIYFDSVFRDNLWRPVGTLGERLWETTCALVTFSLDTRDWERFHGKVPVFGSLFTLFTAALPFVRATRRLWAVTGACYSGIFIWYWVSHQDRYLQALMPIMAAVTAAILVRVWQVGLLARLAATLLVGLQIVWSMDIPFIPTHAMIGTTPYKKVLDLAATGYQANYHVRLRAYSWWWTMKRQLPPKAKVLVHGDLGPLGLERMIVSDMTGWTGGIHYGFLESPAELHALLKSFGVTHVVWVPDWTLRWNSLAEELVFYSFTSQQLVDPWSTENRFLARLPSTPPPAARYGPVLFWGAGDTYENGLYPLSSMTVPDYGPHVKADYPRPIVPATRNAQELLARAQFAVIDPKIAGAPRAKGFTLVMRRDPFELWARAPGTPTAPR
jgi:hypothetical protein